MRELVGQTILQTVPEAKTSGLFDDLVHAVEAGEPVENEWRFERHGQEAWLHSAIVKMHDGVALTLTDVTDRIRATRAIQQREERLRKIMETVVDGIITTDDAGIIETFNPAAERILGYAEHEVAGRPLSMLIPGSEPGFKVGPEADDLLGDDSIRELEAKHKTGRLFPVEVAVGELILGTKTMYIGVLRDITQRKLNEARLKFLASQDPLTGLANRFTFRERLDRAIAKAKTTGQHVGLLFLDLDMLKNINDTLGHQAGDRVLWESARRLERCVREGDTVARVSGDEFVIILDGINGPEAGAAVAREVLDQLSKPFDIDGAETFTSGSVGVVLYPENGHNVTTLLKNVDTALHKAKTIGRNNYQFYNEELSASLMRRHRIENGLRRAVERGEIMVYYQPKVDMRTNQVLGVEALARWNSPQLGLVSPVEFIPVAEETGLILPIGEFVLRTACEEIQEVMRLGFGDLKVAVNLSARQFRDPDLIGKVRQVLEDTRLPSTLLELELTESMLVENKDDAIRALTSLKGLGIALSVDDFGTGYSSLAYLKRFPLDTLKIDRSFVFDLPHNQDDAAITKAIISLANSLDLKIIAEGIENTDHIAFFREHECIVGQGYYYSQPVPAEKLPEVIRRITTMDAKVANLSAV